MTAALAKWLARWPQYAHTAPDELRDAVRSSPAQKEHLERVEAAARSMWAPFDIPIHESSVVPPGRAIILSPADASALSWEGR